MFPSHLLQKLVLLKHGIFMLCRNLKLAYSMFPSHLLQKLVLLKHGIFMLCRNLKLAYSMFPSHLLQKLVLLKHGIFMLCRNLKLAYSMFPSHLLQESCQLWTSIGQESKGKYTNSLCSALLLLHKMLLHWSCKVDSINNLKNVTEIMLPSKL